MFDTFLSRWLDGGSVHRSVNVERVGRSKDGGSVFTATASYGRTLAAVSEPANTPDEALTDIRNQLEEEARGLTGAAS